MKRLHRYALVTGLILGMAACGSDESSAGAAPARSAVSGEDGPLKPASRDLLKVVYIGGSITEGAFSSVPEKSYASLLTAWFETLYPRVEARNVGLGGTGSEFAAYRIDHDLDGFAPDLAFVEFAVNDAGTPRPTQIAQIDALVHKLRQKNPQVKIIYISTTDTGEEPDRRAGRKPDWIQDAAAAAAYSDLQYIDAAAPLWAKVFAGAPVSTFFKDNVHPNDAGHRIYFETIRDALDTTVPLTTQPRARGGKLIGQSKLDTARFDKGSTAAGCRPGSLDLRYMDEALTCDRGESFTYTFTGTTVGLVKAEVRDGGRLACTIDGARPTTADFYSSATHIYERPFPVFLYRDLPQGRHTLACRVTDERVSLPEGSSTGHKVTVGYFMVSDARPVTYVPRGP